MKPSIVPPLRQSLHSTMACSESYAFQVIEGNEMPDSMQSERGVDVHHVMSEYVRHCVSIKAGADWAKMDKLSARSGPVAGPIIDKMRDSYIVDWEHVFDTEITLGLTDELEPSRAIFPGQLVGDAPEEIHGTLDVVRINHTGTAAYIDDYKSHPQPFNPDEEGKEFQAILYCFMLMVYLPQLESVTFTLIFVRYGGNVKRSCEFTRKDMPEMRAAILRAKARQRQYHADYDAGIALPALPGSHCAYCPKITKPGLCSIAEFNSEINTPMEDRLRFKVWSAEQNKVNNAAMKNYVDATGKGITIKDGNGKTFILDFFEFTQKIIPLDKSVIRILNDWMETTGENWGSWKIRISSTNLMSKLRAKKRAALLQQFEDSVIDMTEPKPKFVLRRDDGTTSDGSEEYGGDY